MAHSHNIKRMMYFLYVNFTSLFVNAVVISSGHIVITGVDIYHRHMDLFKAAKQCIHILSDGEQDVQCNSSHFKFDDILAQDSHCTG